MSFISSAKVHVNKLNEYLAKPYCLLLSEEYSETKVAFGRGLLLACGQGIIIALLSKTRLPKVLLITTIYQLTTPILKALTNHFGIRLTQRQKLSINILTGATALIFMRHCEIINRLGALILGLCATYYNFGVFPIEVRAENQQNDQKLIDRLKELSFKKEDDENLEDVIKGISFLERFSASKKNQIASFIAKIEPPYLRQKLVKQHGSHQRLLNLVNDLSKIDLKNVNLPVGTKIDKDFLEIIPRISGRTLSTLLRIYEKTTDTRKGFRDWINKLDLFNLESKNVKKFEEEELHNILDGTLEILKGTPFDAGSIIDLLTGVRGRSISERNQEREIIKKSLSLFLFFKDSRIRHLNNHSSYFKELFAICPEITTIVRTNFVVIHFQHRPLNEISANNPNKFILDSPFDVFGEKTQELLKNLATYAAKHANSIDTLRQRYFARLGRLGTHVTDFPQWFDLIKNDEETT